MLKLKLLAEVDQHSGLLINSKLRVSWSQGTAEGVREGHGEVEHRPSGRSVPLGSALQGDCDGEAKPNGDGWSHSAAPAWLDHAPPLQ